MYREAYVGLGIGVWVCVGVGGGVGVSIWGGSGGRQLRPNAPRLNMFVTQHFTRFEEKGTYMYTG